MKHILMLLLCVINLLSAEGFVADTATHTQQGLVAIENVYSDDCVTIDCGNKSPSYVVTNTTSSTVDQFIKITIKDVQLCTAVNQKMYVLNKGWVRADELVRSDLLLCENKKYVEIAALERVHKKQKMYSLTVESSHVFCVTKYGVIVHNIEPIGTGVATIAVSMCPPLGGAVILGEIIAFGVAGIAGYLIHKKSKQDAKQNRYPIIEGLYTCPCGGKPPKHEDDEDEHPNGTYEGAGYHHKNSKNGKSICPKNGQRALDNSFIIEESERHRIAVDEGQFVVLFWTSPRRFHGHVRIWEKLDQQMKNTLINNGLATRAGKIIKQVMRK